MKERFTIRTYGRSELALLYFPNLCADHAWRKLKEWIMSDDSLSAYLEKSGCLNQRSFTPKQVAAIVQCFGEP